MRQVFIFCGCLNIFDQWSVCMNFWVPMEVLKTSYQIILNNKRPLFSAVQYNYCSGTVNLIIFFKLYFNFMFSKYRLKEGLPKCEKWFFLNKLHSWENTEVNCSVLGIFINIIEFLCEEWHSEHSTVQVQVPVGFCTIFLTWTEIGRSIADDMLACYS